LFTYEQLAFTLLLANHCFFNSTTIRMGKSAVNNN